MGDVFAARTPPAPGNATCHPRDPKPLFICQETKTFVRAFLLYYHKTKIAASAKQPSFFTTILVNHGLYFQPNQEKSRVDRFPAKYHSGKNTWRSLNVNPCFSLNSYCFQKESFYPQRRKKTRAFCKMLISSEKAEWWSCVFPKKFKSRRALILLKQIRYKSL